MFLKQAEAEFEATDPPPLFRVGVGRFVADARMRIGAHETRRVVARSVEHGDAVDGR